VRSSAYPFVLEHREHKLICVIRDTHAFIGLAFKKLGLEDDVCILERHVEQRAVQSKHEFEDPRGKCLRHLTALHVHVGLIGVENITRDIVKRQRTDCPARNPKRSSKVAM
jgi:hypothetical protein